MKIATIKYSTFNIGDDIQSIALERLLPRVDLRVDRDDLSPAREWSEDVRWILNGWYGRGLMGVWPAPGRARKLFVGFHAVDADALPTRSDNLTGCRDPWTLSLCAEHGLDAWLSYCASLTLEPSDKPHGDDALLVDVFPEDLARLPPQIAQGRKITHMVRSDCDRQYEALWRLDLYSRARWVVTTRLHALLPCAAFGTPVVFIKPPDSEHRYLGYTHLAWKIANAPWYEPRPRQSIETVQSMVYPLRQAIRRFITS